MSLVCDDYYNVYDLFDIYDNSIMIIYFKHITHTHDFPLNGYPASGSNPACFTFILAPKINDDAL